MLTAQTLLYFSRMRYVAAYLLAALSGNENPDAKDIKKILDSVGIEADEERMSKVQSHHHFKLFLLQQLFSLWSSHISPLNRSSLNSVARMSMR